jgi:hypothetical protein
MRRMWYSSRIRASIAATRGFVTEAVCLKESLPEGKFDYYNVLVDGEIAFLEWKGFSGHKEVREGADSFVIRGGKIVAQTIHYKVERKQ